LNLPLTNTFKWSQTSAKEHRHDVNVQFISKSCFETLLRGARGTGLRSALARVNVAIYQGATLVRNIWVDRSLAAGSYHWTWNGRTAANRLVAPGHYTAVVIATSWIGTTRVISGVNVLAP
jgi:hypothetical protein